MTPTPEQVARYAPETAEDWRGMAGGIYARMRRETNGGYVSFADYEALATRNAELEAERRMIVSHATMGGTDGEGMSVNAISVKVTDLRNELYQDAKTAASEALEAMLKAERAKFAPLVEAAKIAKEQLSLQSQVWADDLEAALSDLRAKGAAE